MRRLCKTGLDIVQQRGVSQTPHQQFLRIVEHRDHILADVELLEPYLKDASNCRLMRDQLEFWNLSLHRSYILSELCRPAIRNLTQSKELKDLTQSIRTLCIQSLADTVEAFLGLHNITKFAMQSWAAVHRSLSSALLLCILGEHKKNNRVRELISRLTTVMSEVLSTLDPTEAAAPMTRAVDALQKLNPFSTPMESASGGLVQDFYGLQNFGGYGPTSQSDSTFFESSTSSPQMIHYDNENSPYSILNSIMWGSFDNAAAAS
jgi:hypothetical protein